MNRIEGMIKALDRLRVKTATEKTCSSCGKVKPLSAFPRNSGAWDEHGTICSSCNGKKTNLWRKNNKKRNRVSWKMQNAIRSGRLPRANTLSCAVCGEPAEHYHHDNYDKPLDVIPLCRQCHVEHHRSV